MKYGRSHLKEALYELFDQYGFTEHRALEREREPVSLSKYPFELGTLMQVRPRKPYKGSVDVELNEKMRWPPRARKSYAYGEPKRVPGWGVWIVVDRDQVRGVGWWHKVARGDGATGWVADLQKDFVVVIEREPA